MKRCAPVLATVFAVVAATFLLAGCSSPSPEQVLKDAVKASKNDIKTFHFEIRQTTRLPRAPISEGKVEKQTYVQESSGDYDLRTGDFQARTTLLEGVEVSIRQVEQKQYWQIAGNWYEVPQAQQVSAGVTQALSISQYLKSFKSLKMMGDTEIEGEACYHVRGVPNMKELVKQPGITDLLKDPTGKQVHTVDELEDMKVVIDFYVQKKDYFLKRSGIVADYTAPVEFIKQGYAQPGDRMKSEQKITLGDFNKKLTLTAPENATPLPAAPQQ